MNSSPTRRLLQFALLTAAAAGIALWIARESVRPRELPPQEAGLMWLRDEYQLDDATFERIHALHRDYFRRCENMCRQIDAADRPLLWRGRRSGPPPADLPAQIASERALCSDCETAATKHLEQVAALMPPEQGRRFLADIMPTIHRQRLEHDQRISRSTR